MTYAVYIRTSKRHKWRLASLCLDKALATEQARQLEEQSHARGYEKAETKASGELRSAYHAPEYAWRVP